MQVEPVTGIILAGGKSSRFGTNKALFQYKGKLMVERAVETLRPVSGELLLSANQPDDYRFTGLECVADIYRDCGPLGGIHACLLHSKNEHNVIIGCDLPELHSGLYRVLLRHQPGYQVVVPVHHGIKEPMACYFNKNTVSCLEELLKRSDSKLLDAIDRLHTLFLDVENMDFYSEKLFANVNTREDADDLNQGK